MGSAVFKFWEYGDEAKSANAEVHTIDLDNTNIVAQLAAFSAWRAALTAVSSGAPGHWQIIAQDGGPGRTPSLNANAQRETKWLVSFIDNVNGNPGSYTVPCYDFNFIAADGVNMIAGAERDAVVATTEAFAKSVAGNAVTVSTIKFRARTL